MGTHWQFVIRYAVLLILVLLGDGKQSITLVVVSAAVLCLYIYEWIVHKKTQYYLHANLRHIWVPVFFILFLSSLTASSRGYAITEGIRYCVAYLLFVFYSNRAQQEDTTLSVQYLFWWIIIVAFFSLIFTFSPTLQSIVPTMNLLYRAYGHNSVANLLVIGVPLGIYLVRRKRTLMTFLGVSIMAASFLFSFSRGGVILLWAYCSVLLFQQSTQNKLLKTLIFFTSITLVSGLVFSVYSDSVPLLKSMNPISRHYTKTPLLESRIQYWKQAVISIEKKPFFGWGPGSFLLVSKRFQEKPYANSWFAHSYILQIAVEMGIIGLLIIIRFYVSIFKNIYIRSKKTEKKRETALLHAVLLMFIYSFIEMNLDFMVVWIVFWMLIGLLSGKNHEQAQQKKENHATVIIPLTLVFLYYVSAITGLVIQSIPTKQIIRVYIQPYSQEAARLYLETLDKKVPITPTTIGVLKTFHNQDPEIAILLSKKLANLGNTEALVMGKSAVLGDYQNVETIKSYIKILMMGYTDIQEEYVDMLPALLFKQIELEQPVVLQQSDHSLSAAIRSHLKEIRSASKELLTTGKPSFIPAKAYYMWGYALKNTNINLTIDAYHFAITLAPSWSYFYLELASLYYYEQNNPTKAQAILSECNKEPFAKEHCRNFTLSTLSPPGYFKKSILSITL